MAISIVPYTADHEPAVADFNARLKSGGVSFAFPENHTPAWLPKIDARDIYQDYFLAVDADNVVRGSYILKHQKFMLNGRELDIGNYQLPLSEGTIDRAYNIVALQMLTDALRRQPMMYALGMGGMDRPLPMFLRAMKWQLAPVPFLFRVVQPSRFLRNITILRTSALRRLLLDTLAVTGIGGPLVRIYQRTKAGAPGETNPDCSRRESGFDHWADDLWSKTRNDCRFAAVRDRATVDTLYPATDSRFIRLRVTEGGTTIGWAVLLNTAMHNHKQFGNMQVGTIVDCLAVRGHETLVINAATRTLESERADIIVTNQPNGRWTAALGASGYLNGPSNFILAVSPRLAAELEPFDGVIEETHVTRGDGDGPIHL